MATTDSGLITAAQTLVFAAPFAVVIGLLASARVSGLVTGLIGLAFAAWAVHVALDGVTGVAPPFASFLWSEALRGAWLAWQAIAVLAAGIFFHRTVVATQASEPPGAGHDQATTDAARGANGYRALFRACFLLGIFGESLTGFGVGYLIAFGAARELGLRGVYAVVLPAFSQIAVPFGSMAVGTGIGASLAGIPISLMGLWSAALTAPILAGYLLFFWRLSARAGLMVERRDRFTDIAYLSLFVLVLFACSTLNVVELGGIAAAGAVLAIDIARFDRRLTPAQWRARLARVWPYLLVTAALLGSRLVPGARDLLTGLGTSDPFANVPGFAWFYNPSGFLLAAALIAITVRRSWNRIGAIVTDAARSAWRAIVVTLVFVVFAQWLSAAGVAMALAQQALAAFGAGTIVLSPFIGALGGFLTGSNTGSNSMAMPIQAGLAAGAALPNGLLAGIQNTVGSNFALLGPNRLAMMKGLADAQTTEAAIIRIMMPFGAMVLTVAITVLAGALVVGLVAR